MAIIEFKNAATEKAFNDALKQSVHRDLPPKIVYQKFKNGQAVLTVLSRD